MHLPLRPAYLVATLVAAATLIQPHANASSTDPADLVRAARNAKRLANPELARIYQQPEAQVLAKGADEGDAAQVYDKTCQAVVLISSGKSLGTGSIFDKTGLVLTNRHVIKDPSAIEVVTLGDCKDLSTLTGTPASLVFSDEAKDLALILMHKPPESSSEIQIADLADIRIGSRVFALGHPNGQLWTLTQGLVSQLRRGTMLEKGKVDLIQTDAAVNPGNSGGPLLTTGGVMIGVNTFILRTSKALSLEGLNFAVASSEVRQFIQAASPHVKTALAARNGGRPPAAAATGAATPPAATAPASPAPSSPSPSPAQPQPSPPPTAHASPPTSPAPEANECKPRQVYKGPDPAVGGVSTILDLDCNDTPDARFVVPDDKERPLVFDIDRNGDRLPDVHIVDVSRSGKFTHSFWDDDFDGRFEQMGEHPDGAPEPTRRRKIPEVLPMSKGVRDDPLLKGLR